MRGIRRTTGLALAVASGAMLFTPVPASAGCNAVGPVTNCTYVNGTCVQGGGKVGDRVVYRLFGPTC